MSLDSKSSSTSSASPADRGKRWLKWEGSSLPLELAETELKFESSKWLQVDLKRELKQVFEALSAGGKLGAGFETVKATWGKSAIKIHKWSDASGADHSMSFAHTPPAQSDSSEPPPAKKLKPSPVAQAAAAPAPAPAPAPVPAPDGLVPAPLVQAPLEQQPRLTIDRRDNWPPMHNQIMFHVRGANGALGSWRYKVYYCVDEHSNLERQHAACLTPCVRVSCGRRASTATQKQGACGQ